MDDIKNTEGVAPTKITKTWFIQRGQDPKDIFACGEQEAWGLFHNRSNWMRRDFKIIGVSDGMTFLRIMKDSESLKFNLEKKVKELSTELTRYLKTYDKLKYEDLLEDTDPKMIKVKGITDGIQADLDKANAELQDIVTNVTLKAFNAELEVARGHIEHPKNHDIFTPGASGEARDKIISKVG